MHSYDNKFNLVKTFHFVLACSDGLKALAGLILAGAAERLIAPSERRASSASIFAI